MSKVRNSLLKEGVVLIDNLFESVELNAVIEECTKALKSKILDWKRGINRGEMSSIFFDIEGDFLTSSTHTMLQSKIISIFNEMKYNKPKQKDIRMRLTTPYPLPYVQWHRDHLIRDTNDVRITIYLSDVYPDSGEFCYVRGSHLPEDDHLRYSDPQLVAKKGYTAFPGEKGTTIIFNPYGVHSVRPNNTNNFRLALMFYFHFSNSQTSRASN